LSVGSVTTKELPAASATLVLSPVVIPAGSGVCAPARVAQPATMAKIAAPRSNADVTC